MLVSLALIASVCIGEDFAAGEVAFIMQLGGLLEELTVARARAGIEKLVHLTPQTARVITGGKETAVPAEDVKVGEDSSIQRMIRLVQSADAGKAKIVGLSDRWATWIVVIALTAAALTWIISGEIIRAVTILVVFCPCALVLATPTAIMAAIGNATKHGFLVREGNALERLAAVKKITFDKTGTLTYGTPRVVLVHSALPSLSDNELHRLCATAERYSEHPLGKAITRCCQQETGEALGETKTSRWCRGAASPLALTVKPSSRVTRSFSPSTASPFRKRPPRTRMPSSRRAAPSPTPPWTAWAATSPWTPRISRSSTTRSRSCRTSSRSPSA